MINIIITLICGGIAGYIAGLLMHTQGSWLRNIIVGLVGGVIGSAVLNLLHIGGAYDQIGGILVAVFGSCILIWVLRKLGI